MEGFGRDTLRSGLGPAQDGDRARAEASDGASPRRARDSLFLMARMKVGGGDWSEVRVRNLSEGGLMAEYARSLSIGTNVEMDIRGIGPVTGTVAWYTEGRAGVALDHPIDPRKARKPIGQGPHTPLYARSVLP